MSSFTVGPSSMPVTAGPSPDPVGVDRDGSTAEISAVAVATAVARSERE